MGAYCSGLRLRGYVNSSRWEGREMEETESRVWGDGLLMGCNAGYPDELGCGEDGMGQGIWVRGTRDGCRESLFLPLSLHLLNGWW